MKREGNRMNAVIPKVINYCWFGRKQKSKKILKCIDSWKRYMPEYKIIEWNEDNFPIDFFEYTSEAYASEKYAFVSDVARLYALFTCGGIYFDTDIEVLRSFPKQYVSDNVIFAFESEKRVMTGFMAGVRQHDVWKDLLSEYRGRKFINEDGTINDTPNTVYLTDYLSKYDLQKSNRYQRISEDIVVYPLEIFGAFDWSTCKYNITENTVLVHKCYGSWLDDYSKVKINVKKILVNYLNPIYNILEKIR